MNSGPGSTRIDWIDLEYASGEGLEWTNLAVPCMVAASHVVHFNVTDYDGTPCMASFEIRDLSGRVYLEYDAWVEALRQGNSYVSDGSCHLMDFQQQTDGSFRVRAASMRESRVPQQIELIVNGLPVETKAIATNGQIQDVIFSKPKIDNCTCRIDLICINQLATDIDVNRSHRYFDPKGHLDIRGWDL